MEITRFFDIKDTVPPANRAESLEFFRGVFQNKNPLVVEIGSGNGHFLVEIAMRNPGKNYIGTEMLMGRARKFHAKLQKRDISNLAIFKGDARIFVWEFLYENTVEEFIIFFPYPWPKKKHHKNRLLKSAFLKMLRLRLQPAGIVSIATDSAEYRDWVQEEFEKTSGFLNLFDRGYIDFPDTFPPSLFEMRFKKEKRDLFFMQYQKEETLTTPR